MGIILKTKGNMQKHKWARNSKKSKINAVMPPKMPDIHDIRIQSEGKKLSKKSKNWRHYILPETLIIILVNIMGRILVGTPIWIILSLVIVGIAIYLGMTL